MLDLIQSIAVNHVFMRFIKIIGIFALSLAVITGCSKKSENETGSNQDMTEEAAKKTVAEFQENRDQFISESQARLDSLEKKLTEVGREMQSESGEAQRKMEATWSNLKKQTGTIRSNLENLKEATQKNWPKLKSTAADQIDYLESQISEMEEQLES